MAVYQNFSMAKFENLAIAISITPPTAVGTWDFNFSVRKRFNGESGLITKVCTSGYGANQSGITIANSGNGQIVIRLNTPDTSGLDPNYAYAYALTRVNSGANTVLTEGYLRLLPSMTP